MSSSFNEEIVVLNPSICPIASIFVFKFIKSLFRSAYDVDARSLSADCACPGKATLGAFEVATCVVASVPALAVSSPPNIDFPSPPIHFGKYDLKLGI